MRIGEESVFRIGVRHMQTSAEVVARIAQQNATVALLTRSIAQALVVQLYPVRVVLDAVGRHLVVGIVGVSGVHTVVEPLVFTAQFGRGTP